MFEPLALYTVPPKLYMGKYLAWRKALGTISANTSSTSRVAVLVVITVAVIVISQPVHVLVEGNGASGFPNYNYTYEVYWLDIDIPFSKGLATGFTPLPGQRLLYKCVDSIYAVISHSTGNRTVVLVYTYYPMTSEMFKREADNCIRQILAKLSSVVLEQTYTVLKETITTTATSIATPTLTTMLSPTSPAASTAITITTSNTSVYTSATLVESREYSTTPPPTSGYVEVHGIKQAIVSNTSTPPPSTIGATTGDLFSKTMQGLSIVIAALAAATTALAVWRKTAW